MITWPLEIPEGLYEAIYHHADALEGYSRYARYAQNVAHERNALTYLGDQEDMYWAVGEALRTAPDSRSWRMIDVGSGLGYLTTALRSAGYDCIGIDISAIAIAQAVARFGPWFERQDVFGPAPEYAGAFDVAFLLETIEHVPDPVAYLAAVKRWLRPNGRIVLTTPNRDAHPIDARWRSDLPPVHLYWFSERAVDELADRVGLVARHTDFTAFNQRHEQTIELGNLDQVPEPSLSADMRPLRPIRLSTRMMERLHEVPPLARAARAIYDRGRRNRKRLTSSRSFSIAAILEAPRP